MAWIEGIHIERFGACRDLTVDGFGPGTNVIVGPNEAGKSTVAEFARGVLFGFRRRNAASNVYESSDGLPRSGWLTACASDGRRFRIERKEAPKRREGVLTVWDEYGVPAASALSSTISLDETNANDERLFAFDLDGLRDLDRATLRGRIVGTSLGFSKVNPLEIVRRIRLSMKALTARPSGDLGPVASVMTRLSEVERELKVRCQRPKRHNELVNRLEKLARSAEELSDQIEDAEAKLRSLCDVLRHEEECARLTAVDREISALSDARAFPAQGLVKLEQLIERLDEARKAAQGARNRSTGIAQALKGLDDELAQLGPAWTRERLEAFDPSLVPDQDLHRFSQQRVTCREALSRANREVAAAQEKCKQLAATIDARENAARELSESCRDFLTPEQRALVSEWKDHQATARHRALRFSEGKAAMARLDDEAKRLTEMLEALAHDRGAGWAWILVAILLFVTTAGGLLLVLVADSWSESYNWLFRAVGLFMAIAGPAGAFATLGNRRAQQRRVSRQQEKAKHRIAGVSKEMRAVRRLQKETLRKWKESRARMAAIAGTVLGNPSARAQEITAAVQRSVIAEDAVRKRKGVEESLRQTKAQLDAERIRMAAQKRTLDRRMDEGVQLEAQWHRFLREKGIDEDLEPEEAAELNRHLMGLKKDLRRITELRTEHDLLARGEQRMIADLEARMTSLLKAGGVEDEDSFRKQAVRHDRLRALEQERAFLVEKLKRCGPAEEDPLHWATSIHWAESRAEAGQLEQRIALLKEELGGLLEERGRVIGEMNALESGDDTDRLLAERERLRARLNDVAREWIVLRLAERLLSKTVSIYEAERRPRILERGSEIFRAITGDSFDRILFSFDGSGVTAERADGTIVPEECLSRGALEQLYLALRLAHIEVYGVGEAPAPLVMDDVLVNFDPERVKRSVIELEAFSQRTGVQILFFTCHPHVAACFSPEAERIYLGQRNERFSPTLFGERSGWYAGT